MRRPGVRMQISDRSFRRAGCGFVRWLALAIGLSAMGGAYAQSQTAPSPVKPPAEVSAAVATASARQAALVADAERLHRLADELRAEVAKTNGDTLSLSVLKKAQEVEALAHSLKERLKGQ